MDSHSYESSPPGFECLLAAGAIDTFTATAGDAFSGLQKWAAGREDWLFGHFAYDLTAETEGVTGPAADPIGFPDLFFFIPIHLIRLEKNSITIECLEADPETIWWQISEAAPAEPVTPAPAKPVTPAPAPPIAFTPRFTRDEYLSTVDALRQHILRGDCYEINFCQEFFAQPVTIDPYATWCALSQASPNPFAAFYRVGERYLLCASPERYLKKTGDTLFSQPIKGTAPRQQQDPAADDRQREALYHSGKDRAENVMVVDLVRNDLARICIPGSVRVAELYGIYPFPQVFQMISTVTGEMLPGLDWTDAIRASFPMGSMTGAPKHSVARLIARYERSRRGLFSGAVGYVTPNGDFDFNVVIRSLLYNRESRYLSYQVGSGITFYSDPAAEYEECLVKAEGIRKALGH
ncbi:MAG TPA: anthranilate synthase component I family protein [Puia sp.]|nr:anthranilate synthase component I family protein [Puia sp.]